MEQLTPACISDRSFRRVAALVYEAAGLSLNESKKSLVTARLSRRIHALGLSSYEAYLDFLQEPSGRLQELESFINSLTTNKTDFFREPHHFHYLKQILPDLVATGEARGRRSLRVWSSACSTGEEPYSLAMVLHTFFAGHSGWKVQVLASDIDTQVLATASAGIYSDASVADVPPEYRARFFKRAVGLPSGTFRISSQLRSMVLFRRINLIYDTFKFRSGVDIIFCRNVIIYFDDACRRKLMEKFYAAMGQGSFLFLGHSESLRLSRDRFRFCDNTVYQKL